MGKYIRPNLYIDFYTSKKQVLCVSKNLKSLLKRLKYRLIDTTFVGEF